MVAGVKMQSSKSMKAKMTLTNIFALNLIVVRSGSRLMQLIQIVTIRVVNLNFIQLWIMHLHTAMLKKIISHIVDIVGLLCQNIIFWMASSADGLQLKRQVLWKFGLFKKILCRKKFDILTTTMAGISWW